MSDPGFASSKALARFRLLQPYLEQDILVSALLIIGYSLLWRTGLLAACIFGIVFSVVIYLFFTAVMRVPLPIGPVPLPF